MKTNPSGSLISLDHKSPISWSEQIRIGLMRLIATGGLQPGDKVPSIRNLSRDLKVTQALVRKAFDQLVEDGWLEVRSGLGTYVSDHALDNLTRKSNAPVKDDFLIRDPAFEEFASSFGIPGAVNNADNELPPEFVPSMETGGFMPAHDTTAYGGAGELNDYDEDADMPSRMVSEIDYDQGQHDDEYEQEEQYLAQLQTEAGFEPGIGKRPGEQSSFAAPSVSQQSLPPLPRPSSFALPHSSTPPKPLSSHNFARPNSLDSDVPEVSSESIEALLKQVPMESDTWSGVGTGEFLAFVAEEQSSLSSPQEAADELLKMYAPDQSAADELTAMYASESQSASNELASNFASESQSASNELASNFASEAQSAANEFASNFAPDLQSAADELASMSLPEPQSAADELAAMSIPEPQSAADELAAMSADSFEEAADSIAATAESFSARADSFGAEYSAASSVDRFARPAEPVAEPATPPPAPSSFSAPQPPAESFTSTQMAPAYIAPDEEEEKPPSQTEAPPPVPHHSPISPNSASSAALSRWAKPEKKQEPQTPPAQKPPQQPAAESRGRSADLPEDLYGRRSDTIDISGNFASRQPGNLLHEGRGAEPQETNFAVQSEEALFPSSEAPVNMDAVMADLQRVDVVSLEGFDSIKGDDGEQQLKAGPEFYDESGMFAPDTLLSPSRFLGLEQEQLNASVEGSIWANNLADVFSNATVYGVGGGGRDLEVSSVTALVEARWQSALKDWIEDCSTHHVGLSEPAGMLELREQIADWLRASRGMTCSANHVIIVNGAQEGRDLAARLLIDRGKRVAFEEPGSVLNRLYLEAHGAEVMVVNVDESGIIIDELDALEDVPVLYTMPSAHFPTGAVLSRNRRLRVLDWAVNTNAMVIEDDINCEFFYDSRVISSIHAFDTENRTIYIGSLSHIIPPSWRLGFMVVPPAVRPAALRLKSLTNRCTSPIVQRLVLKLFQTGFMQEQARKLQRLCEQRRQLMLQELQTWPADMISFSPVKGGLTQTIWLPADVNDIQLYRKCQAMGFSVIPASPCFQTYPVRPGLVLNFGAIPSEQMLLGLSKLKDLLTSQLE